MKKLIIILFVIFTQTLFAQWTDGQSAQYVVGQPDDTTYSSSIFNWPQKVAIDYTNGKMYVANTNDNEVLRFAYPVTGNDPSVEVTFGTGTGGTSQNQFSGPFGVAVYNGTLWVSDQMNNRILKFSNAYSVSTNAPNADGVLGQTNYTNSGNGTSQSTFWYPSGIYIDASGNLWVADEANNRVLEFAGVNTKSDGANADLVLGQSSFSTGTSGTSSTNLNNPWSVAVLNTTIWVADYNNNRVLRFDNPTSNGAAASGVLGQSTFGTANFNTPGNNNFYYPEDLDIDPSGRLYVSDEEDARIMIFNNAASKANGGPADNVIGQTALDSITNTNSGGTNYFFNTVGDHNVEGVTVDAVNDKLLVADQMNNRVMVFSSYSILPVELTTFTVSFKGTAVQLNWQTATEVNSYCFEIQRYALGTKLSSGSKVQSSENKAWEKIGFVKGSGNSNSPKSYSFVDENPLSGKVEYRLKQIDNDGKYKYSNIVELTSQPSQCSLAQNYPNPFNPTTMIQYSIPKAEYVTLKVYDELGKEVKTLVDENKAAGQYNVQLDGSSLASGIYYYRISAGTFNEVKKLMLLK